MILQASNTSKAQPMPHRTVSWNRISRSLHDSKPKIPAGLLSARAFIQFGASKRPLVACPRLILPTTIRPLWQRSA